MQRLADAAVMAWTGLSTILTHPMVWTCFTAWFIASLIKLLLYWWRQGRMNFRIFVGTGGMPSSHSAFVACLATAIGREAGWGSPVFLLALGFAIVTMNDAQGVRRASGHQAAILNRIADDIYQKKPFRPERVKELLGHTPIQVLAGFLIGVACGLILYP